MALNMPATFCFFPHEIPKHQRAPPAEKLTYIQQVAHHSCMAGDVPNILDESNTPGTFCPRTRLEHTPEVLLPSKISRLLPGRYERIPRWLVDYVIELIFFPAVGAS